jgi:hypothetical protein
MCALLRRHRKFGLQNPEQNKHARIKIFSSFLENCTVDRLLQMQSQQCTNCTDEENPATGVVRDPMTRLAWVGLTFPLSVIRLIDVYRCVLRGMDVLYTHAQASATHAFAATGIRVLLG